MTPTSSDAFGDTTGGFSHPNPPITATGAELQPKLLLLTLADV
jgi:hypothetical protein